LLPPACIPHGGSPPAGPARAGALPVEAAGVREVASAPLGPLLVRKWRLENGLAIITVPDPAARSISYVTAFRVGSRDENAGAGQTGLAHLCEHLMFAGTRGYATGEFDRRLEAGGGSANATTSYDFTSYVDDIPPALLADTVRLEADRMINLQMGPADVTAERDIVVEERLQSAQDDIDGELEELVWEQAFRAHPYRWPVIGRMADIKAVTKDGVCNFYQAHYRPARAVVIVAGRFDEGATLALLASAYGGLPAGEGKPAATVAPERAPARETRSTIERPVPAERFMIGYPAPGLGDPDRPAYELLDELLAGGPSARLPRALMVERALASSVDAEVAETRDPGLWTIVVQSMKGVRADAAEDVIQQEIGRLLAQPVSAAELEGARNRLATAFWRALSSSQGRADALGRYDVITGDFRTLLDRGPAYARVTPDDVTRVARLYLGSGARSVVVARPKEATP
jgi:zinc protease